MIRQVATDNPVLLAGQSMGGLVAMRLAQRVPELVSHVVLIESGVGAMSSEDLTGLSDWFDLWPDVFVDADEAARFFGPDRPSTPAWVAGLRPTAYGLVRRFGPQTMVALMADLAGAGSLDIWRDVAAASLPCTLVVADGGFIPDEEIDMMVRTHPTTSVVRVANSGHDVHLDQPEAVAEAIADIAKAAFT